jgi:hypothetical protein
MTEIKTVNAEQAKEKAEYHGYSSAGLRRCERLNHSGTGT